MLPIRIPGDVVYKDVGEIQRGWISSWSWEVSWVFWQSRLWRCVLCPLSLWMLVFCDDEDKLKNCPEIQRPCTLTFQCRQNIHLTGSYIDRAYWQDDLPCRQQYVPPQAPYDTIVHYEDHRSTSTEGCGKASLLNDFHQITKSYYMCSGLVRLPPSGLCIHHYLRLLLDGYACTVHDLPGPTTYFNVFNLGHFNMYGHQVNLTDTAVHLELKDMEYVYILSHIPTIIWWFFFQWFLDYSNPFAYHSTCLPCAIRSERYQILPKSQNSEFYLHYL